MDSIISKQRPHRNTISLKTEVIETIILIGLINIFLGCLECFIEFVRKFNSCPFVWFRQKYLPINSSAGMHAILRPMSASRYLSKQVRYDNRTEGICFKIKISQVWLTPSSWSNEEYSRLASLIKAMDHISARAQTQHTHTHTLQSCSFLSQCASVQWITMFLIIFSQNKHKHTHTSAVICPHHCCRSCRYWCSTHSLCACVCVCFVLKVFCD